MKECYIETKTATASTKNRILHNFGEERKIREISIGSGSIYLIDKNIRIELGDNTIKIERNDSKDFSEEDIEYIHKIKSEIEKLPKYAQFISNDEKST
jgi:hypothetical protein